MKQFTLNQSDVHDLSSVLGVIVQEQSDKLEFKEVIALQKAVNTMRDLISPFVTEFDKIGGEKNELVELANKKISSFKQKLAKKADDAEKGEDYKAKLDEFVQEVLEDAQNQIKESIAPQYDTLYNSLGKQVVVVKLEEDKLNLIVINFEKYAKEKYNNKSRMIEVYDALVGAKNE